jgi:hypothetical protein
MRRSITLVALALVVAACSNGQNEAGSTTPPRAHTTASTTTTSEPTTTAGPCDPVSMPAGATDVTTATGDVDGDGENDTLHSYVLADESHLQVSLAVGGGSDLAITTFSTPAVEVLGGADVDGDGADEVWARTGFGASATIVGLARFRGCELVRVTFAGGEPVELAVGGSVGLASGVECGTQTDPSADLTTFSATNMESDRYEITATEYALEGTTLVQKAVWATHAAPGDDAFARATGFTCHGLSV